MKSIETQILGYLRGVMLAEEAPEAMTVETDLFQAGALESIRVMRLVAWLEKTYEFQAQPADLTPENFRSVADISAYVAGRCKALE